MHRHTGWSMAWAGLVLLAGCRAPCGPCAAAPRAVGTPDAEAPATPRVRTFRDYQDAHAAALMQGIDDPDTVVDWAYVIALVQAWDQAGLGGFGRGGTQHGPILRDEEVERIGKRLHAALPRKRGAALVPAVETAARLQFDRGPAFRDAAIRAWPEAGVDMRAWLLQASWSALRDPRMVPLLLAEIERERDHRSRWHVDDLPTMALLRYVELEPKEGRARVLADIAREAPKFGGAALTALPDARLREVDASFRRPVGELTHGSFDMEKHARLAERYGGEDTLEKARAILDDPKHVWNTHLLRVVMSRDREDAFQRMARALEARDAERPYRHRLVLRAVLASNWIGLTPYWGPDAAAFVRGYVDDADPHVAQAATRLLEEHDKPADAGTPR